MNRRPFGLQKGCYFYGYASRLICARAVCERFFWHHTFRFLLPLFARGSYRQGSGTLSPGHLSSGLGLGHWAARASRDHGELLLRTGRTQSNGAGAYNRI